MRDAELGLHAYDAAIHRLLAALLDEAFDELFGVGLQDGVDLVEQRVELVDPLSRLGFPRTWPESSVCGPLSPPGRWGCFCG